MLLNYFLQAWRSTSKTLLILHVTRPVSPDFYLFRNFWKGKSGLPYPHNQTFWFLVNIKHFKLSSLNIRNLSRPLYIVSCVFLFQITTSHLSLSRSLSLLLFLSHSRSLSCSLSHSCSLSSITSVSVLCMYCHSLIIMMNDKQIPLICNILFLLIHDEDYNSIAITNPNIQNLAASPETLKNYDGVW